jgi:hypothetical protein
MRRTVGVPAETTLDMVSLHRPVTRNDVLDGGCQQMAVVRGTGSEGRSIVEGVGLLLRRQFELPLESIDFLNLGVSHCGLSVRAGRDGRTVHWARIRSSSLGKLTAMIVSISGRVARKVMQWYSTFLAAPTHRGGVTARRWDEVWGNSWLNFPPSAFCPATSLTPRRLTGEIDSIKMHNSFQVVEESTECQSNHHSQWTLLE